MMIIIYNSYVTYISHSHWRQLPWTYVFCINTKHVRPWQWRQWVRNTYVHGNDVSGNTKHVRLWQWRQWEIYATYRPMKYRIPSRNRLTSLNICLMGKLNYSNAKLVLNIERIERISHFGEYHFLYILCCVFDLLSCLVAYVASFSGLSIFIAPLVFSNIYLYENDRL
jgi:hypothetical protein